MSIPATKWFRWRFTQPTEDWRPVGWPVPGPYWCSGYDSDNNAILIAWLPYGVQPDDDNLWPEAEDLDLLEESAAITYSGRFPKPDWFHDPKEPQNES